MNQSSSVQQMVASGSPNWWSMRPPLHHHQLTPLNPPLTPAAASNSWNDNSQLELPDSWSQLLLSGGLVGEDDIKSIDMIHMQAKKLENWEQQIMNHHQSSNTTTFGVDDVIKQENSYTYNNPAGLVVSATSPKSCVTSLSNIFDFSHKSPDVMKLPKPDPSSYECNSKATGGATKRPRIQPSSAQSTFKVRKEKLGDRITALHQLVSPFGKTDTASVLLEAIGYIRFLQSQIEALSVPYLGSESRNMSHQHPLLNEKCIKRKGLTSDQECDEEAKNGLRSRGLCLVPISCMLQVESDINGADYWAPGFDGNI